MSNLFGKASYGGAVKRNWWKLKDGAQTFRILPPMGELAAEGRWSAFYKIHFGYKNSKGQLRTFQSPLVKNHKNKMIEVPDAALERLDTLKAKLAEAKKAGNTQVAEQLEKLVGYKGQYNLDSNHYLNVMDTQGNIGILKLRHRAKLALDAEIKRLRESGVDPLGVENGRYFVFTRSGNSLDTVFQVAVLKRKINVQGVGEVEQDVAHTLTEDDINQMIAFKDGKFVYKKAVNLATLFKKPSAAEVARIVSEGAKAVDEILDTHAETTESPADEGEEDDVPNSVVGSATATAAAPSPTTVQATIAPQSAPQVQAVPVAVTTSPPLVQTSTTPLTNTTKTTAKKIAEMSEAEFMASIGLS